MKIDGAKELIQKCQRLSHAANRIARAPVRQVANEVRDEAKLLAPKLTGHLAGKIESHDAGESGRGPVSFVEADDPNAVHQEYGTSRMPASPFMRPAADRRGRSAGAKAALVIGRKIENEAS